MKKIVLAVAFEGYQQLEYGIPREILTSNDLEVLTASDKPGVATAKDGSTTEINLTLNDIVPSLIDGLFLIGGPGALEHLDNKIMHNVLQQMAALKKPIGAICISPRILAKAQVLSGKEATGWDGDNKLKEIFNMYNVIYVPQAVVTDGLIVTATGPDASQEFADAILKLLNLI